MAINYTHRLEKDAKFLYLVNLGLETISYTIHSCLLNNIAAINHMPKYLFCNLSVGCEAELLGEYKLVVRNDTHLSFVDNKFDLYNYNRSIRGNKKATSLDAPVNGYYNKHVARESQHVVSIWRTTIFSNRGRVNWESNFLVLDSDRYLWKPLP